MVKLFGAIEERVSRIFSEAQTNADSITGQCHKSFGYFIRITMKHYSIVP